MDRYQPSPFHKALGFKQQDVFAWAFVWIVIFPLVLLAITWSLQESGIFLAPNQVLFLGVGVLIEGIACAIWFFKKDLEHSKSAMLAGIFGSGLIAIIAVGLFRQIFFFLVIFFFSPTLRMLWQLMDESGSSALYSLSRWRVYALMLISALSCWLFCGIFYLGYSYLRPDITIAPLPSQINELSSSDWVVQASGTYESKVSFFTTPQTKQSFIVEYDELLRSQGWSLYEQAYLPYPKSNASEDSEEYCCYFYKSASGNSYKLIFIVAAHANGSHVRLELEKR